jgi:site-specific DNA-methyltransferase (adenine-specific)
MSDSKQIRKAVELETSRKLEQRAKAWLKAAKEQGGASSNTRVIVNELLAISDRLAKKPPRKIKTRVEEPPPAPTTIGKATLYNGDNIHVLRSLPSRSIDAMVVDPPSGIAFMSNQWDRDKGGRDGWIGWLSEIMAECNRVLKPGAHALVWALPRTSHWTATALEDAGFEVRDIAHHIFGCGFPKSLTISNQIDAKLGVESVPVGEPRRVPNAAKTKTAFSSVAQKHATGEEDRYVSFYDSYPQSDAGKEWAGWQTALKPACEHWILVRKPLEGTVVDNVLNHNTGGINVDACRVGTSGGVGKIISESSEKRKDGWGMKKYETDDTVRGRWPAHLILSHNQDCTEESCTTACPVSIMDDQSGQTQSSYSGPSARKRNNGIGLGSGDSRFASSSAPNNYGGTGGASRYFTRFLYTPKPSNKEKSAGLDDFPTLPAHQLSGRETGSAGARHGRSGRTGASRNFHPTVKPEKLMRWLVRLVTPKDGVVLDCFMGSGTTGIAAAKEGVRFIGIERDSEYFKLACARVSHHTDKP